MGITMIVAVYIVFFLATATALISHEIIEEIQGEARAKNEARRLVRRKGKRTA